MIIYYRGDHGCVLITSDNIKQQAGAEWGQTQRLGKSFPFGFSPGKKCNKMGLSWARSAQAENVLLGVVSKK